MAASSDLTPNNTPGLPRVILKGLDPRSVEAFNTMFRFSVLAQSRKHIILTYPDDDRALSAIDDDASLAASTGAILDLADQHDLINSKDPYRFSVTTLHNHSHVLFDGLNDSGFNVISDRSTQLIHSGL